MGIQNLWTLIDVVGRRINIESLQTKMLAVDASIWLIQFVKAMRDQDGKMLRNAHLLGTLRRVTKLLFHRIKPVFVFDGGTPLLKQKTLAARRRRRDQSNVDLKKTAQRLFLNQLKQKKKKTSDELAVVSTFQPPQVHKPVVETIEIQQEEEETSEDEEFDSSSVQHWTNTTDHQQDIDHLNSLPPRMQKEFIAQVQREHRQQSRSLFLPLAGQPEEYSHAQLTNFLKTSALNRKIKAAQQQASHGQEEGHRIASDSSVRYILEHQGQAAVADSRKETASTQEDLETVPQEQITTTDKEKKMKQVSLSRYFETQAAVEEVREAKVEAKEVEMKRIDDTTVSVQFTTKNISSEKLFSSDIFQQTADTVIEISDSDSSEDIGGFYVIAAGHLD